CAELAPAVVTVARDRLAAAVAVFVDARAPVAVAGLEVEGAALEHELEPVCVRLDRTAAHCPGSSTDAHAKVPADEVDGVVDLEREHTSALDARPTQHPHGLGQRAGVLGPPLVIGDGERVVDSADGHPTLGVPVLGL